MSAVSSILQNVRQGKVLSDISIFGERGEFIQAVALETSDITNRPLKKIAVPKGVLLVCIIRNGSIIIPTGDSVVTRGGRDPAVQGGSAQPGAGQAGPAPE